MEWDGSSAAKVLRHSHNSVIGELFKVVAAVAVVVVVVQDPCGEKAILQPPLLTVSTQNACMNTPANNKKKTPYATSVLRISGTLRVSGGRSSHPEDTSPAHSL